MRQVVIRSFATTLAMLSFLFLTTLAEAAHGPRFLPIHPKPIDSFISIPVGYAYSGYVNASAGSAIGSVGPTVPVYMGCSTTPSNAQNNAASDTLNAYGSFGTVSNTITPSHTATSSMVQTTSTIQHVNLLQGLITADLVKGVATSNLSNTQSSSVGTGSTFSGLRVAGLPIVGTPAPNTQITLPGIGYVILNKQNNFLNLSYVTGITIDMIDVVITTQNALNLPVGTEITVAHAYSYLVTTAAPIIVNAQAYGLSASGLGSLSLSPGASAEISCGGDTVHDQAAGITSPALTVGASTATTTGQITTSVSTATSQASIANVNLLNGLFQADAITASAQVSWNGSGSKQGTVSFTNAEINGSSFSGTPYPNSWVTIPGLGYVILNEQSGAVSSTDASQDVYALDLHVTESNAFGLPLGARIIIDQVHAGVVSYTYS